MQRQFAIVIPTLNEEVFLPKLLDNLKDQVEQNFTVTIVDGSSEDNTVAVANSYNKFYSVTVVTADKRNIAYQRNLGAKQSQTDYIIFLDADCGVEPAFTQHIAAFVAAQAPAVIVPYIYPDDPALPNQLMFFLMRTWFKIAWLIHRPFSSGGSMTVKHDYFIAAGGFDETVYAAEDHLFIQTAYHNKAKITYPNTVRVQYSLRRERKEGFKLVFKYIFYSLYILVKGKITKPLYDYHLGGKYYQEEIVKIKKKMR